MPIAQACFVIMKVCEGLDYAHNKRDRAGRELNLVHRDVSPAEHPRLVRGRGEAHRLRHRQGGRQGLARPRPASSRASSATCRPSRCAGCRSIGAATSSRAASCSTSCSPASGCSSARATSRRSRRCATSRSCRRRPTTGKIPDELERIVLKALAKDVEDRYQNAIDLHDDLQAFVYTAGEFYSRKDLAAWMKRSSPRRSRRRPRSSRRTASSRPRRRSRRGRRPRSPSKRPPRAAPADGDARHRAAADPPAQGQAGGRRPPAGQRQKADGRRGRSGPQPTAADLGRGRARDLDLRGDGAQASWPAGRGGAGGARPAGRSRRAGRRRRAAATTSPSWRAPASRRQPDEPGPPATPTAPASREPSSPDGRARRRLPSWRTWPSGSRRSRPRTELGSGASAHASCGRAARPAGAPATMIGDRRAAVAIVAHRRRQHRDRAVGAGGRRASSNARPPRRPRPRRPSGRAAG